MICLEGLPNSNNNTDGIDDAEMYTSINKESSESENLECLFSAVFLEQEEAPPIVPYEGEIYSGVEKTGLFPTNTTSTSTPTTGEDEEPRYHTTQFNGVSKTVTGISDEPQYSIARAVHSSKEQFNEEPLYDTTFTKIAPSEQEPHYSTTIRNVPKTATAQVRWQKH